MSTLGTGREVWKPQSESDREVVLAELTRILLSAHFCNSKRYPAFLRYVVEKTLEGKADTIKERNLGVDVFGRAPDFDTNSDTIVRYTAGEVRKRLTLYYYEHEEAAIQISLPVGSYIPEFLHSPEEEAAQEPSVSATPNIQLAPNTPSAPSPSDDETRPPEKQQTPMPLLGRFLWASIAALVLLLTAAAGWLSFHRTASTSGFDAFWEPALHNRGTALIVTGGNVFSPNLYSGTETAAKGTEYPFVSIQIASAIAQLSGVLQKDGISYQMRPAAATSLTDLRERTVVLIGGYNNEWTLRLLNPLRFHFTPVPRSAIVDRDHPETSWERDRALPYSSADDYAIVCRFRDTTTDSLVFVAAGLGRNGTEAAGQFITSPHYLHMLEERLGHAVDDKNVEALLKVGVIDGKTGAPSLVAVHTW